LLARSGRFRIFLSPAEEREGCRMQWEILLTEQVETFLDDL
jgi:hypothetical protein